MLDREKINQYMRNLYRFLAPLEKQEADEVVREIESHLYDVIEQCERDGQQADLDSLLQRFGTPRELAEQYVDHVQTGAPLPAGFTAMRSVKRGLTSTLYLATLLSGYGASLFLLVLGGVNAFLLGGIGISMSDGGDSIVIALMEDLRGAGHEVILNGLWISPIAVLLGSAIGYLTFRVLRLLSNHSRQARYA